MAAAAFQHPQVIALLLDCPEINVNQAEDEEGFTALTIACRKGNLEAAQLLL